MGRVEESTNTQRMLYLFTGKELDEETGLYFYGCRPWRKGFVGAFWDVLGVACFYKACRVRPHQQPRAGMVISGRGPKLLSELQGLK